MGKLNVPATQAFHHKHYKKLLGADFSCDQTECDIRRSPDTLNMISDNGGNPVKRFGWRTKYSLNCGKVLKLFLDNDYVISEKGIYKLGNPTTQILSKAISKAEIIKFNGEVYAFADGYYKLGDTLVNMEDEAYIPEIAISRSPSGNGGTSLESVNLLTSKRKVSFLGDASSTRYNFIPLADFDNSKFKYVVADSIKVEIQNQDGIFEETTAFTKPTVTQLEGLSTDGTKKTYNLCQPYITFSSSHNPSIPGQDNVRITFEGFDATLENGVCKGQYKKERELLFKTSVVKAFGYTAMDRIFCIVGDNRVYYSGVNKPNYFPDDNYLVVGHETKVVGLHRVGQYLVAIKEDSSVESTVYLIDGANYDDITFFSVTPAIGGIGAISSSTFETLSDEPLFLARTGIYAITNTYTTLEKILRNRSYLLDKRLCEEPNLETAVAISWNRYYILSVNGHCYVLDGRKKTSDSKSNTDYLYEGYYWENVHATCFSVHNGDLYFGTEDGKVNRFNSDVPSVTAYCDDGKEVVSGDNEIVLEGGIAIPCRWTSPLDDDSYPQYFKTLSKKGNLLTLLPYDRSSVTVSFSKDGDEYVTIGTAFLDIFNWKLVDFARFPFNSNDNAKDVYTNKKVKKYKRLQLSFENNVIYEPFGILEFTKTYTIGNFSKDRR